MNFQGLGSLKTHTGGFRHYGYDKRPSEFAGYAGI